MLPLAVAAAVVDSDFLPCWWLVIVVAVAAVVVAVAAIVVAVALAAVVVAVAAIGDDGNVQNGSG